MARSPAKNKSLAPRATRAPVAQPIAPVQVDFIRPEVSAMLPEYATIRDCVAGSTAVKGKRETYLPRPNADDKSPENLSRYDAYVLRAVFYNVSQRTLNGMVGEVFSVPAVVKVPDLLNPVIKDATGHGVPAIQLAKSCLETVLEFGRSGILVDYPSTDNKPTTRKQQLDGSVRPTLSVYEPDNIINWRTDKVGGDTLLSLVVLRETYDRYDDGFAVIKADQFRVLRLVGGIYKQEVWRKEEGGVYAPVPDFTVWPKDAKGQHLKEIPFTFVGSTDNSPSVDAPPMFALCDLNIAHYRNSADHEEAVFITGQATPVLTGLTVNWVKEVLNGEVRLGSRTAIALPEGATATLLQMSETSAAFTAMEHKERQMVSLGAKLVEQTTVQRTATEAGFEEAGETSILKTITENVSAAFQWALEWCAIYQGVTTTTKDANTEDGDAGSLAFTLNTDFKLASLSAEDVKMTIEAWQKDAISYTEMRGRLRQAKLAVQSDAVAKAESKADAMEEGTQFGNDDPNTGKNNDDNANDDKEE